MKYIDKILIFLFYRTTGSISTKLSKKHPWVKRIRVCSKRPHLFTLGDNNKIAKVLSRNLNFFTPELLCRFYNIYNDNFAQIYSLIWNDFSGKRCGPRAFCFYMQWVQRTLFNPYQTDEVDYEHVYWNIIQWLWSLSFARIGMHDMNNSLHWPAAIIIINLIRTIYNYLPLNWFRFSAIWHLLYFPQFVINNFCLWTHLSNAS